MVDYHYSVLLFLLAASLQTAQGASINPAINQINVIKLGGNIEIKWRYQYTDSEELIRIQCGKTVTTGGTNSGNQIQVIAIVNKDQSASTRPQAFTKASAETKDNVITIKMEDLKKDSIGDYSCEMTYFDLLASISKTIISAPIRLTTTDSAADDAEAEKSQKLKIIIIVVVVAVCLVLIIIVIACCIRRRQQSTPHHVTNEKKNGKKLTKQDIHQSFKRGNRDEDPKYAQVEVVSTPDEAIKRPYRDDVGDDDEKHAMKEYV